MKKYLSFCKGFTLIELLVVIAILAILAAGALALFDPISQLQKANDGRRKSDLLQIQKALEQYHTDNGRYPLSTGKNSEKPYRIVGFKADHEVLDWGEEWQPYMQKLSKDPQKENRYVYYASADGQAYWLYASLEKGDIDSLACNKGKPCKGILSNDIPATACGAICNYGVSSRNVSP